MAGSRRGPESVASRSPSPPSGRRRPTAARRASRRGRRRRGTASPRGCRRGGRPAAAGPRRWLRRAASPCGAGRARTRAGRARTTRPPPGRWRRWRSSPSAPAATRAAARAMAEPARDARASAPAAPREADGDHRPLADAVGEGAPGEQRRDDPDRGGREQRARWPPARGRTRSGSPAPRPAARAEAPRCSPGRSSRPPGPPSGIAAARLRPASVADPSAEVPARRSARWRRRPPAGSRASRTRGPRPP